MRDLVWSSGRGGVCKRKDEEWKKIVVQQGKEKSRAELIVAEIDGRISKSSSEEEERLTVEACRASGVWDRKEGICEGKARDAAR